MTIEVYTQVHRQASHYDPQRGTPSAWLLTLTRSRAIDRLRIETLRRAREESLDETATIASLLGDPEACSASSELRRIVQHALSRLTPEQREAIEIAYYAWALARVLITFLLDHMVPPGAVLLAGDDTVTEHPGPHVFGKGRHCDGVRSTHSYAAYRWGHKWVVVSVLVKLPLATRPWALPVLVAFHPQRRIVYTARVIRRLLKWPGCCWRAWCTGFRRVTSSSWAIPATAPDGSNGFFKYPGSPQRSQNPQGHYRKPSCMPWLLPHRWPSTGQ